MVSEPSAHAADTPTPVRVARALLSVSDKRGIVDFARGLDDLGVELVSTGGTAAALREAGLEVRTIDELTNFPEIMDGRVKTLNPRLYASLLAVRDDETHMEQAAEHEIEFVDLVCVNLYPFERTAASRDATRADVIENIDIGGPTMIRAAAKNHAYTATTRESLAAEAFATTARYDVAIARWFAEQSGEFPPLFVRAFEKITDLPYGENPHQRAAFYAQIGARATVLSQVKQHHGKELSYNNLLDLDSARSLLRGVETPACSIIKHNNPCGVAIGDGGLEAYRKAFACDPLSAYGGVIALNRPVDAETAEALAGQFIEVLIAPAYDDDALEILTRKKNIRILEDNERRLPSLTEPDIRQVTGGLLVADGDYSFDDREDMRVATQRQPDEGQWRDLLFAWHVCRHVKSNAIVVARDGATVGIGAGQMSRVDSVRLAVEKSEAVGGLTGGALASDAFFPFADGPELAVQAGVTSIIQPGGSIRDDEVVAAAEEAGVVMVLTGTRHFRH